MNTEISSYTKKWKTHYRMAKNYFSKPEIKLLVYLNRNQTIIVKNDKSTHMYCFNAKQANKDKNHTKI